MSGVKLTWKGERVTRNIAARLEIGIVAAAKHFAFKLRQALLQNQGSNEEKIHSEPYEIPYYITTKLASSIRVVNKKKSLSRISIDIKSRLDYDRFLEEGTYKMEPRPHWMIVYMQEFRTMKSIIIKSFKNKAGDKFIEGIEDADVKHF